MTILAFHNGFMFIRYLKPHAAIHRICDNAFIESKFLKLYILLESLFKVSTRSRLQFRKSVAETCVSRVIKTILRINFLKIRHVLILHGGEIQKRRGFLTLATFNVKTQSKKRGQVILFCLHQRRVFAMDTPRRVAEEDADAFQIFASHRQNALPPRLQRMESVSDGETNSNSPSRYKPLRYSFFHFRSL